MLFLLRLEREGFNEKKTFEWTQGIVSQIICPGVEACLRTNKQAKVFGADE